MLSLLVFSLALVQKNTFRAQFPHVKLREDCDTKGRKVVEGSEHLLRNSVVEKKMDIKLGGRREG